MTSAHLSTKPVPIGVTQPQTSLASSTCASSLLLVFLRLMPRVMREHLI
jgi:hypothetical protein